MTQHSNILRALLLGLMVFLILPGVRLPAEEREQDENKCCCTTYDMGKCLTAVEEKVDALLNDTYDRALKRWNEPQYSAKLRNAERAWIAYRDANCDAELSTYDHGSAGLNMSALCRIRLTRQRIEELKHIYLQER